MRDDHHRASPKRFPQILSDSTLGLGIERRRRFIQDQHAWIAQQRPRQRHSLPFTSGKSQAAFAGRRIVAFRDAPDQLIETGF